MEEKNCNSMHSHRGVVETLGLHHGGLSFLTWSGAVSGGMGDNSIQRLLSICRTLKQIFFLKKIKIINTDTTFTIPRRSCSSVTQVFVVVVVVFNMRVHWRNIILHFF